MSYPRIIPCLLLGKDGLVKTAKFAKPRYIGDPVNTVRIFNEKEVDELFLLDITATVLNTGPKLSLIEKIAAECRMPLTYGGGIKDFATAEKLISMGVEKISLSSIALEDTALVRDISEAFGRQSTAVCIDYKRGWTGKRNVMTHNGTREVPESIEWHVARAIEAGAGEIVLNSISDDGMMKGYDLALAADLANRYDVPMTFLGGAGKLADIQALFECCGNVGAGVGSLFVFKGGMNGILINYPSPEKKEEIFRSLGN